MPSQLFKNEAIYFLAAKNFTYRGEPYVIGDEFPQEEANNIETLIRSRFVIPVVDDVADKPRHWHTHVRTREQAEEYLNRDRVQLVMPEPYDNPDSDDRVDIEVLTHPELTPEPEGEGTDALEPPEEPEGLEDALDFDPADYNVDEVRAYLKDNPEDRDAVVKAEKAGRGRKGILEE